MDINQKITSLLAQSASQSRFAVSAVPRHIHNNIDAPYVFMPYMVYAGSIQSSGSINFAPKGWTVSRTSTGIWVMTHNLNTMLYSVTVTTKDSGSTVAMQAVPAANTVTFYGIDVNTGAGSSARADAAFMFALVAVSNKSQQPPSYTGTIIS